MPQKPPSYTELTHQIVRESEEPLPFAEIMARVDALRRITSKNPKQTIRGAISESQMILSTGDRRFGWKTRLITGSLLRHTLQAAELGKQWLYWDIDVRDALWPGFFATQKYGDQKPITASFTDGKAIVLSLEHVAHATWGSVADHLFWDWLEGLGASAGDHLLIEVLDGMAKRYALRFEPRSARDEAALADRNRALVEAGRKRGRKAYGVTEWELTAHLLAIGFYKDPIPPDPFSELWPEPEEIVPPAATNPPDLLASALFGQETQAYDFENPAGLPPEYDPANGRRRPRPSALARRQSVTSFSFRVYLRGLPQVWRDLELAEDNTFEDLHLLCQQAFGWSDDHLYSFFLSGSAWDRASEVGSPWSDASLHTHQVQIGDVDLEAGGSFLYLFDYGDGHEFGITLLKRNPLAPKGDYPRIVGMEGEDPAQYPDFQD
jgi:hypothetical protein